MTSRFNLRSTYFPVLGITGVGRRLRSKQLLKQFELALHSRADGNSFPIGILGRTQLPIPNRADRTFSQASRKRFDDADVGNTALRRDNDIEDHHALDTGLQIRSRVMGWPTSPAFRIRIGRVLGVRRQGCGGNRSGKRFFVVGTKGRDERGSGKGLEGRSVLCFKHYDYKVLSREEARLDKSGSP